MRIKSRFAAIFILICISSVTMAADFVEVSKTLKVNASVEKVWGTIGGFCAIQDWHPAITKCQSYDDHGTLYRTLTLADGATISEKHAGEEGNSYTYYIKSSPLPVKAYKATLKADGNDSETTITWEARFRSKDKSDEEAKAVIEGIFDEGLNAIQAKFN